MKILKFLLISVVVGFLGGYATTVFSKSEAQLWGSILPSKNFLGLGIDLSGHCITHTKGKWSRKTFRHRRVHISGISAIINKKDILTKDEETNTIGLSIIPYVVSNRNGGKLLAVIANKKITGENFNKFYPVCFQHLSHSARSEPKFNKFYPLILLHVESKKNRKSLERHIKALQFWDMDFLTKPIKATTVSTVRNLLKKVFSKKQAKFLKGLRFNVCVELIDEEEGNVKFQVGNFGGSSPCKPALPKQSQKRTENTQTNFSPDRDDLSASNDKTCEQPPQKDAEAMQCQETSQKLATCKNKIVQVQERISQLEQEKTRIEANRNYLETTCNEANSGIDKLMEENDKLKSQIERLKREKKLKQARQQEGTNLQLKKLENKLERLTKKREKTTEEFEKLTQLTKKRDETITELEDKVDQLTKERDDIKKLANQPSSCDSQTFFAGNHKLIVVSLSKNYSRKQKKAIKNGLVEVLSNVKRNLRRLELPFTLLTIQSGKQLHTVLTSNQLRYLNLEDGSDSILGRIENGIGFGARDLRALEDLGKLDTNIKNKANSGDIIGSVLYLTDNIRLNTSLTNQQWKVSLAWCRKRIGLTVLTTKECEVWDKLGAKCTSWQNKAELISELNAFLNAAEN
ncbi:hypothetical protein [Candidatus Parabeggiatoa sp. HSG14]|uniref:hypothetical protein n=1 Tax=Candidatus Parabeggiatoa sp. HSG14 TaxID=3055593 RepID=UPI0025A6DDB1|nr:hypothetical protein [Thiotrichales bacterium HSG14]